MEARLSESRAQDTVWEGKNVFQCSLIQLASYFILIPFLTNLIF